MSAHEYTLADYDTMLADAVRTPAYLAAITHTVRPGDVVIEVGTGVGYFAVAAARAGARHVYAIERDASVALASSIIRENGCEDRVTCIHGDATRVSLPERGTVLLSDLRGLVPYYRAGIATIMAARDRLLEPGARLIPVRDTVFAAPCEPPDDWREVELTLGDLPYGIARHAASYAARSALRRQHISAGDLLAPGAPIATIEYATVTSPDLDTSVEWTVARDGVAEGIALWFDANLADGIAFSTAPGAPRTVYGNGFLPFDRGGATVRAGDRLACRIRAKLVDGVYVFVWDTVITPASGGGEIAMHQSSLGSVVLTPGELARRRATHTPAPAAFAAARQLLTLADGQRSLADIAAAVRRDQPGRFPSDAAAISWVAAALASIEDLFAAAE